MIGFFLRTVSQAEALSSDQSRYPLVLILLDTFGACHIGPDLRRLVAFLTANGMRVFVPPRDLSPLSGGFS